MAISNAGNAKDQIVCAHDDLVDQSATLRGCRQPQRHAQRDADADRDQSDRDRSPCSDHDHRKDVAPEVIGAEPVQRRGGLQLVGDIKRFDVERRPEKGYQRTAQKYGRENEADDQVA